MYTQFLAKIEFVLYPHPTLIIKKGKLQNLNKPGKLEIKQTWTAWSMVRLSSHWSVGSIRSSLNLHRPCIIYYEHSQIDSLALKERMVVINLFVWFSYTFFHAIT